MKMKSRQNTATAQMAGEYLVAAQLCRMELIATTFSSHVQHYDVTAMDARGRHIALQVKTSRSDSWHLSMSHFCEVRFKGHKQIVGRPRRCPVPGLLFVFVRLASSKGKDQFFICDWSHLRKRIILNHKAFLARHRGVRPQNWKSLHTAVSTAMLQEIDRGWKFVTRSMK
jgi:hypothetical protein